MDYELSFERARIQLDVVHGFLTTSYWSPGVRREIVAQAIANSLVLGVYESSGNQVGFARVVTDSTTFAWLADVFVLESHQKRGLAKRMMASLMAHPDLQTVRRWCLGTRDAHGLYAQFGFGPVVAERWMEKKLPSTAWSDGDIAPT